MTNLGATTAKQSPAAPTVDNTLLAPSPEQAKLEHARQQIALYAAEFRNKQVSGFTERDYEKLQAQVAQEIEQSAKRLAQAQQQFDKANTWWPSGWAARWSGALAGARQKLQAETKLYEDLLVYQCGMERNFELAKASSLSHLEKVEQAVALAKGKSGVEAKQILREAVQQMDLAEKALTIKGVDRTAYDQAMNQADDFCQGRKGLLACLEIGGKEARKFAIWGTAAVVTAAIALPLMAPMAAGVGIGALLWYGVMIPAFAAVAGTAAGTAVGAATSAISELQSLSKGEQTASECFKDFTQQLVADVQTAKDGALTAATVISAGKAVKACAFLGGTSATGAATASLPGGATAAAAAPGAVARLPWIAGMLQSSARAAIGVPVRFARLFSGIGVGSMSAWGTGTIAGATVNGTQAVAELSAGNKDSISVLKDFLGRTYDDSGKSLQIGTSTSLALTLPAAGGRLVGGLARVPVVGRFLRLPATLAGEAAGGAAASGIDTVLEQHSTGALLAKIPFLAEVKIPDFVPNVGGAQLVDIFPANGEAYYAFRKFAEGKGALPTTMGTGGPISEREAAVYEKFAERYGGTALTDGEYSIARHQAWRDARLLNGQFYEDRLPSNMLVGAIVAPLSRFLPQAQATSLKQWVGQQLGFRSLAVRGVEVAVATGAMTHRQNPQFADATEVAKHSAIGEFAGDIFRSATRGTIR